ncbi:hypothetical protein DVW87_11545 [Sphingomonas aracearum]|uniref:Uncharacterized protein n=1 Tax=Sphingomonas aracearum TaxID=2283317 RepID=A0A369VXD7_9SPHN|nr:hypothetical protein DVW87_11545 [Sphingomonas aracearum]
MLALLSACSSPGGTGDNNAQDAAIANRIELASNGKPVPAASATPARTGPAFPPPFVARWGRTAADCDPSSNKATGLLVINTDGVRFFDTEAGLSAIDRPSEYTVTAQLAFKQAGAGFGERQMFALTSGGTALLRTDQATGKTERYDRC